MIHFNAVPKNEVLVVGTTPDIDIGHSFVYTFNAWKRLNGFKDIGFDLTRQDTELLGIDLDTSVSFFNDTGGKELIDDHFFQFLVANPQKYSFTRVGTYELFGRNIAHLVADMSNANHSFPGDVIESETTIYVRNRCNTAAEYFNGSPAQGI